MSSFKIDLTKQHTTSQITALATRAILTKQARKQKIIAQNMNYRNMKSVEPQQQPSDNKHILRTGLALKNYAQHKLDSI